MTTKQQQQAKKEKRIRNNQQRQPENKCSAINKSVYEWCVVSALNSFDHSVEHIRALYHSRLEIISHTNEMHNEIRGTRKHMVFINVLSSCERRMRGNLERPNRKEKKPEKKDRSTTRNHRSNGGEKKREHSVMTPVKHSQRNLKWPEQNGNNQINNDKMGIYRHMRVL